MSVDTLTPTIRDRYREAFARIAPELPGHRLPWLRRERERAMARFAELGLPSLRDEDWKYTSVAPLEQRIFDFAPGGAVALPPARVAAEALAGAQLLVFVDGRLVPGLSRVEGLPAGVRIGSLAEVHEGLEAWLADGAEAPAHGFAALNAALWADGALLELAPGAVLEAPLHLLFVATRAEAGCCPRNLVLAGAGARGAIVEHYLGLTDGAYLTNAATRVFLAEGAELTHTRLQAEGPRAWHIAEVRAAQERGSRFESRSFAFGGLLSRVGIATRLDGEDCATDFLGLYLARGRQHMDHHTRIDHARPRGVSRQLYKGVVDGAARAVFNGKVIVHPDAQGSDALQSNRNLLLSREAEVDTKPQLEIYADDVKCSHGATVGQLDAEQIYYLRSRGVGEAAARALLTHAFAAEVVARVDAAGLRERLERLLRARLPAELEAQP
jgi:Fe-S cluster assembly protein SufD